MVDDDVADDVADDDVVYIRVLFAGLAFVG